MSNLNLRQTSLLDYTKTVEQITKWISHLVFIPPSISLLLQRRLLEFFVVLCCRLLLNWSVHCFRCSGKKICLNETAISTLKIWSIANFTTNTSSRNLCYFWENVSDQLTKATAAASQQRRKDSVWVSTLFNTSLFN